MSLLRILTLGSQGQRKPKSVGFIFSHTLQMIRMKFDMVLKQIKLDIFILFLSES